MMSSISNSGYQLIISAPNPQAVKDQVYRYQEFHSCMMEGGGQNDLLKEYSQGMIYALFHAITKGKNWVLISFYLHNNGGN